MIHFETTNNLSQVSLTRLDFSLHQKICIVSAVLLSMGSSFHHLGDRTANSHDFFKW